MWYSLFFIFLAIKPVFSEYDVNKTKQMLYLAQTSYCPKVTPTNWDCTYCENSVILEKVIEHNGAKALVGYHSDYDALFVAFRGSENIENWLNNIKIDFVYPYYFYDNILIDWSTVGIEEGFYITYQDLEKDIIKTLTTLKDKYKTTTIYTTGHSLGAISTILAFEIFYFYPEFVVELDATFGSPRIGNQEFVDAFKLTNTDTVRVTHYYDMVPHVPQELLNYKHVPNEVWYNEENTNYKICDDLEDEDDSCSNSCAPLHCDSTSDHMTYIGVNMGSEGDC
jgi:predicted lipase